MSFRFRSSHTRMLYDETNFGTGTLALNVIRPRREPRYTSPVVRADQPLGCPDDNPRARLDLPALDHLRVNSAIDVIEVLHQRRRDGEVTHPGIGVDVDRRAARDALEAPQANRTDREFAVHQIELDP